MPNGVSSVTENARIKDIQNNHQFVKKENKLASLFKNDSEKKDYSHLSQFLQNQIYRGKDQVKSTTNIDGQQEDTFSQLSKKNKYNNALIEKVAKEVKNNKNS